MDLVIYILNYDKRFVICKGKVVKSIISPYDERYKLLATIPKKVLYRSLNGARGDEWTVNLKINDNKEYCLFCQYDCVQLYKVHNSICQFIYKYDYHTNIRSWNDFVRTTEI